MVHGIVLAAGQSSRMGQPKAGLPAADRAGPTFAAAVTGAARRRRRPGGGRRRSASRGGARGGRARSGRPGGAPRRLGGRADCRRSSPASMPWTTPRLGPSPSRWSTCRWCRSRRCACCSTPGGGRARRSSARPSPASTATRSSSTAPPSRRCAPRRSSVGAKAVIAACGPRVLNVPTDDAGVLRDVDTPAEYARAARRSATRRRLTRSARRRPYSARAPRRGCLRDARRSDDGSR